ncbi:MarR family winged helix-turn-helix transcriptional regulator [Gudongella sp. DL1XJH-153]|uniref:MarR family winged helix-turn-helix transcriptional regulator n=1 Tax=Gudongella sp. DL1XJH-153 TaxID=3409804 RepID=UPI003BB6B3D1
MNAARNEITGELLARFFQLSNKLQTYLDQQLKEDQLTTKQMFLMIVIGSFDSDPGFSEISDRFGTSRQNVKQIALKLEKNGYVEIYTDEKDSRFKRIRFTNKATDYWKKRDEMDMLMLNKLFGSESIEQMKQLRDTMRQIDASIDSFSKSQEDEDEDDN